MFAVGECVLPETGGSMFVVIAGLFVLIAGVIVTRWVRQSAGRLSVVVAPLVLLVVSCWRRKWLIRARQSRF